MIAKEHTQTREEWLTALGRRLDVIFEELGYPPEKKYRVTIGWPSVGGMRKRGRVIGECWSNACSADQTTEIFVSPLLADSMRIAGVLAHEMIHMLCGLECGHKGPFKKLALAIGLEGPMTATTESDAFKQRLAEPLQDLGPYPGASLDATFRPTKKQSTRMLKACCPDCQYTVRLTRKWAERATPVCPIEECENHLLPMQMDNPEDEPETEE